MLDLAAREEFVLTITEKGFGKRSSAYDYPITGRGGQGRDNIALARGQGRTIAVFPVAEGDQIMLVTDGGMVIRVPVDGISIRRRRSGGVVVFKVDEGERVVSVARFPEAGESGDGRIIAKRTRSMSNCASGSIPARSIRSPTAIPTSSCARPRSSTGW